jgi:hypothetical protein
MKPIGIVIHHSLTKDGQTVDWDGIKHYHMQEKGWSDIGYHAGVERINGELTTLTGRPIDMVGAHTIGHNDTLGICIVGNFDQAPPDEELLTYAAQVTAGYLRLAGLPVESIHRHHEYAEKSCPGKLFPWEHFIELVQAA